MKVVIQDLASRISEAAADRHPEKWQRSEDPDPLRRTIVAALSVHGWESDGIPGVIPFICSEVAAGRIAAFSAFNDLPCSDVSLIRTNPAQWYVSQEAEERILRAFAGTSASSQEREQISPEVAAVAPAEISGPIKQRHNILDQPIAVAIEKAGSNDTNAVWVQLKELALDSTPPFSGEVTDRELRYTSARNKPAMFTKKSLGQRLRRAKEDR